MAKKLTIFVILVLAVAMAAFSGGQSEKTETEEKIVLKFWKGGTETVWHDYYLAAFKRYQERNPNIEFEYAEAPWGKEIDAKLNVAFASGTAPDIISHAIYSMAERSEKGHYEPLDEYMKGFEGKDDMMDAVAGFADYKGKFMGLPYYPVPEVFVYRKDFFEEAGLDPENPPTTWEELEEYALKLVIKENGTVVRGGLTIPIDVSKNLLAFGRQNGAVYFDEDNNPAFYNDKFVEALAFMTKLYKQGVTLDTTANQENTLPLFVQGRSAMSNQRPSQLKTWLDDNPDLMDEIGFMRLEREQGGVFCGNIYYFMSSETEYKDEVWDFMQFLWEKDEMWERYLATNNPPLRKSLADQYIADNPYMNTPLFQSISDGVGNPKVTWSGLFVNKYLRQAAQKAFYGELTPAEALKEAQTLLEEELELSK